MLIFYLLDHVSMSTLQIFNSKLVLASPETATDADYAAILGVIGHEVCNAHYAVYGILYCVWLFS